VSSIIGQSQRFSVTELPSARPFGESTTTLSPAVTPALTTASSAPVLLMVTARRGCGHFEPQAPRRAHLAVARRFWDGDSGARHGARASLLAKATFTPISGRMRRVELIETDAHFDRGLLAIAVGMMAMTLQGIFHSG